MAPKHSKPSGYNPLTAIPDAEKPDLAMDVITMEAVRSRTAGKKFTERNLRQLLFKTNKALVQNNTGTMQFITLVSLRHRLALLERGPAYHVGHQNAVEADTDALVSLTHAGHPIVLDLFTRPASVALSLNSMARKNLALVLADVCNELAQSWSAKLVNPAHPFAVVNNSRLVVDQAASWCNNLESARWELRDWAMTTFGEIYWLAKPDLAVQGSAAGSKRKDWDRDDAHEGVNKKARKSPDAEIEEEEDEMAMTSLGEGPKHGPSQGIIVADEESNNIVNRDLEDAFVNQVAQGIVINEEPQSDVHEGGQNIAVDNEYQSVVIKEESQEDDGYWGQAIAYEEAQDVLHPEDQQVVYTEDQDIVFDDEQSHGMAGLEGIERKRAVTPFDPEVMNDRGGESADEYVADEADETVDEAEEGDVDDDTAAE